MDVGAQDFVVPEELPLLPLREMVVFPYMVLPLFVARERSIAAVEDALAGDRLLCLVSQRDPDVEDPEPDNLYRVGTVVMVLRVLRMPDGRVKVLVQGLSKAQVDSYVDQERSTWVRVTPIPQDPPTGWCVETEALVRTVRGRVEELLPLRNLPPEVLSVTANVTEPGQLADLIASHLSLRVDEAQEVLEVRDAVARLRKVDALLRRELDVTTVQAEIQSQAQDEMTRGQREHILREQLRAIQAELGESGSDAVEEAEEYRDQDRRGGPCPRRRWPSPCKPAAPPRAHAPRRSRGPGGAHLPRLDGGASLGAEHRRLPRSRGGQAHSRRGSRPPLGHQGSGPRVPGGSQAARRLARSDRLLRGTAGRRQDLPGPLDRPRHGARVRAHLPGWGSRRGRDPRPPAHLRRCAAGPHHPGPEAGRHPNNPVFMLDEIDKLGSDYRGDPSSALLEVLDPEQNSDFSDHYLNVPFDLSKVLFIATANMLDSDPRSAARPHGGDPLPGYTPEEKLEIARSYLIGRTRSKSTGCPRIASAGPEGALRPGSSQDYTREAGVRNLERRDRARSAARPRAGPPRATTAWHRRWTRRRLAQACSDRRRYESGRADEGDGEVGVANGLAWTESGGEVLVIEIDDDPRAAGSCLTGQLGDVMKESGQAALTWCARASTQTLVYDEPRSSIPPGGPRPRARPAPSRRTAPRQGIDPRERDRLGLDSNLRRAGACRRGHDGRGDAARAGCCPSAASARRPSPPCAPASTPGDPAQERNLARTSDEISRRSSPAASTFIRRRATWTRCSKPRSTASSPARRAQSAAAEPAAPAPPSSRAKPQS